MQNCRLVNSAGSYPNQGQYKGIYHLITQKLTNLVNVNMWL